MFFGLRSVQKELCKMFVAILLYEKGLFFSKALKCLPAVIPRALREHYH